MGRFRTRRRRAAALGLSAFAALSATTALTAAASGSEATIDASKRTVDHRNRIAISGQFPGAPSASVEILSRRAGGKRYRLVKTARTDEAGNYHTRVRPAASGRWRAQLARRPALGGESLGDSGADGWTNPVRVRVRSRTNAKLSTHNALVGRTVRVSGRVRPGGASRAVKVRVGGRTLRDRTGKGGRFSVSWRPRSSGDHSVRVLAGGNRVAKGSSDRAGRLEVFRPAAASWYGPGFYGNRTACGQTLTTSTLGVAHKSMPCGTKLTLRYRGREVKVRVIDRGPYVGNREFDLTGATRSRLGFGSTGTVLTSR